MICRTPRHPGSVTEPRARYASLPEARAAARTMADKHSAAFTILQAVETTHPRDDTQLLL